MNFFKKFGKKQEPQPEHGRPLTVNQIVKSISFDRTDCEQKIDRESEQGWLNKDFVAHLLKLTPPVNWNFDLTQPQKAEDYYEAECTSFNGKLLSMEVTTVDGREALIGLFKYRDPENPKGRLFVGIIWIPFKNCTVMVNVESKERGTTGLREAMVFVQEPGPEPEFAPEPIKVSSAEEMFAHMAKQPLKILPSDAPKWDEKFPEHPLTLVRSRLKTVAQTLKLSECFDELQPFRIG